MDGATLAEKIEAEAAEAEREYPDAPADDATDAEAEPAPAPAPAPLTEKQLAAISRKLDAESDRHESRLRELIGADFDAYVPCPLCMTDGHVHPAALANVEPERLEVIQSLLGHEPGPELKAADWLELCPKCDGWGEVQTPAKNAANAVVHCRECQSRGYRDRVDAPAYYPPPAPPPPGYPPPPNGAQQAWTPPPPPVPYPGP